ncbi:Thiamine pyrophosphate enzyme C-terminal TPP-binding [Penicillium malachiteum]|uniref:Thiamine pyrophosphate enzyme C-terminal TPP-binding n=1 Tax=Penicillium malachiteum TaxID=1324776 RepID=A0AAD6HG35_9EURO|nr:Thiamine pyrophosphate enzyme C-terminal TPP-binding [Penicillium malachiteum]
MPVFDALHNNPHFEFFLPRHEQGGSHMVQGYARISKKVGVLLVTSGPGATNLVTPLQDALKDGTPLVALTGEVPTYTMGTDAFQEADFIGITTPCTKWNRVVPDIRDLPAQMNDAFRIATSGRPGPVLVVLPKDVTTAVLEDPIRLNSFQSIPTLDCPLLESKLFKANRSASIQRCAELINQAQRPVIYAVTTSLLGLGCFDERDPKSLPMLGMHGTVYANKAIQAADLILALGARFDDRAIADPTRFAPATKEASKEQRGGIIHFEIHPPHINKAIQCDEFVLGDVTTALTELLPYFQKVESRPEWMGQISDWKKTYPMQPTIPLDAKISPEYVIMLLSELTEKTNKRTIITTGAGSHQMWAAQYFRWTGNRSLVTPGGAGTMGFGIPAALGAQIAEPDAMVIDIDGDASLGMSLHEMASATECGLPIKILVINNNVQSMITQWQDLYFGKRHFGVHQRNADFVNVADGMNFKAQRVDATADVQAKLEWFIHSEGLVLLDVKVNDKVPVLPWVPTGKSLDEMMIDASQLP